MYTGPCIVSVLAPVVALVLAPVLALYWLCTGLVLALYGISFCTGPELPVGTLSGVREHALGCSRVSRAACIGAVLALCWPPFAGFVLGFVEALYWPCVGPCSSLAL